MITFIKNLRRFRWYILGRLRIRKIVNSLVKANKPVRVILGSSSIPFEGWIDTDLPHFDITKTDDWAFFFRKNTIDNLLAEHVFEHLTYEQAFQTLLLSGKYLKKGGIFRVAVPDGYNPSPSYIEYVKPGGSGPGCDDHKILWNKDLLQKLAGELGFNINLLQYYGSDGSFIDNYSDANGTIRRTFENLKHFAESPPGSSSLIADFVKPG